jgi:hypothetical protein
MGSGKKSGEKWLELDAVVIGIQKGHLRFELFVDPDLAFEYRRGADIPMIYMKMPRGENAHLMNLQKRSLEPQTYFRLHLRFSRMANSD